MPTMSRSLTSANSTSSSDLSSPPNTRCRSCLAVRLGVSGACMVDFSPTVGRGDFASHRITSNVSFTLSFKRFGSLLWQREAKVAEDGCSGVSRIKPAHECGGTGAKPLPPHFSAGRPPRAIPPARAHCADPLCRLIVPAWALPRRGLLIAGQVPARGPLLPSRRLIPVGPFRLRPTVELKTGLKTGLKLGSRLGTGLGLR